MIVAEPVVLFLKKFIFNNASTQHVLPRQMDDSAGIKGHTPANHGRIFCLESGLERRWLNTLHEP